MKLVEILHVLNLNSDGPDHRICMLEKCYRKKHVVVIFHQLYSQIFRIAHVHIKPALNFVEEYLY